MTSVRATAPVRVADVGGWTDTWFGSPGQVCHLAVGPGIEVIATLTDHPGGGVRLIAPNVGLDRLIGLPVAPPSGSHALLEHAIAAVLDAVSLPADAGIEIEIRSAVPPGASLGTSAAVLVAVIGALDALVAGGERTPADIARLAHHVETDRAGRQAGVQDQWAAALGGCGLLAIGPYPEVRHRPVVLSEATQVELGTRMVTVVFGAHDSSKVHAQVINDLVGCSGEAHERARSALRELSALATRAASALVAGDLDSWADVLVRATDQQQRLHPDLVGGPHQAAIEVARSHGAVGWKVNGAGGAGGSLTVVSGTGAGAADSPAIAEALTAADPGWQVVALAPSPGLTISR